MAKRKEPFMPKVTINVEMDSHEMGTVLMEKIAAIIVSRMDEEEHNRIIRGVFEIVQRKGDQIIEDAADVVNQFFADRENQR